ncbi:MAG: ABC transporter substrate-binding protein [Clostridia bacterium]|nr:ABC transporter substrate-binding protein [Lachnospiraceae bacterium]NCC01783.1 ABC transporter substrate-binding protein [Clostridia bacterium]NCD02995.1 ABC transporter substrate-binding protein [Clostridia bacterium]
MKKMTKVISLTLAASLVVASLTACGGGEKKAETKAETAAAGETTAAAGDDVFLIGGIGPLTGDAASYGVSVKQGAEIAIEEINAAGGVKVGDKTYSLDMEFADDEAAEDKAIQAYNTVMDKGAQAILGCVTSGACIAITDLTSEDGILQITPSGSAMDCTKNDNAFRICFTDPSQGVSMADMAVETLGYKKIAVLYDSSSDYSMGIREAFEEEVASKGGEIVASEAFTGGDVDFNTQLTSIKGTDADAIFVPAYYQDATYITKQAKDMGMELPFLGSDGWDGVLGTVTDTTTVEGAIFLSPFFAADPSENVAAFVKSYEAAYSATPDQFAADAYDTVYAIAAAMEKAGTIESADLIAAMTEITVDGLTGDGITWTADGEPNKGSKFIQIKDGAYTLYE